jgi:hypothetical protein
VDEATAVRMGHLAGWKTVVIGAVTALSTGCRMSLRAVDAESVDLLGARSYLIKGGSTCFTRHSDFRLIVLSSFQ